MSLYAEIQAAERLLAEALKRLAKVKRRLAMISPKDDPRARLARLGLTQRRVAADLGKPQATVSRAVSDPRGLEATKVGRLLLAYIDEAERAL